MCVCVYTCPAHSSMVPSKVKLQHDETGEQQCQKKAAGSGIEARSSERVGEESVPRVKCVCVFVPQAGGT